MGAPSQSGAPIELDPSSLAQPLVDRCHLNLQRGWLRRGPRQGASRIEPEPPLFCRHDTKQLRRREKRCELVAAGEALDTGESFLRRHRPDRDHLQPILLAIGRMHEQIPEVAGTARLAQRLTQLLHVTAFGLRVARPGRQAGRGGVKVATDRSVRSRYIGRNHCARADFSAGTKKLLGPKPKRLISMVGPPSIIKYRTAQYPQAFELTRS